MLLEHFPYHFKIIRSSDCPCSRQKVGSKYRVGNIGNANKDNPFLTRLVVYFFLKRGPKISNNDSDDDDDSIVDAETR